MQRPRLLRSGLILHLDLAELDAWTFTGHATSPENAHGYKIRETIEFLPDAEEHQKVIGCPDPGSLPQDSTQP